MKEEDLELELILFGEELDQSQHDYGLIYYHHGLSSQRIHSKNCKRCEELKKIYPQLYK